MKYLFSAKKWICLLLSFFILFTQIISLPVAYAITVEPAEAPNDPESIYDLVVLVVDSKVKDDEGSYLGLRYKYPGKLTESDLDSRIERYAKDLSAEYDLTDTKILTFDGDKDTVADLAEALENMYLNGDGTLNNRLAGVVLIGDIPLPVVNKNGNRYVSVFPYTDFTEKAYIYNPLTNNYERNEDVEFPKPEIWHGVIRAPGISTNWRHSLIRITFIMRMLRSIPSSIGSFSLGI